jgi:hypothetical protein
LSTLSLPLSLCAHNHRLPLRGGSATLRTCSNWAKGSVLPRRALRKPHMVTRPNISFKADGFAAA